MTQPAPQPPDKPPAVTYEEFARLDLRVARVRDASTHPAADRLLVLSVDDGSGVPRQICAGIRAQYDPASLVGRDIVIVANLQPRVIRGQESRGMLLAASAPGDEGAERRVVILRPDAEVPPGSIVS
jgi:methionine--tRNA ligase beta chain